MCPLRLKTDFWYEVGSYQLKTKEKENYMGVLADCSMTVGQQCYGAVKKANVIPWCIKQGICRRNCKY